MSLSDARGSLTSLPAGYDWRSDKRPPGALPASVFGAFRGYPPQALVSAGLFLMKSYFGKLRDLRFQGSFGVLISEAYERLRAASRSRQLGVEDREFLCGHVNELYSVFWNEETVCCLDTIGMHICLAEAAEVFRLYSEDSVGAYVFFGATLDLSARFASNMCWTLLDMQARSHIDAGDLESLDDVTEEMIDDESVDDVGDQAVLRGMERLHGEWKDLVHERTMVLQVLRARAQRVRGLTPELADRELAVLFD